MKISSLQRQTLRAGLFFFVFSIFNIFSATDPIGTRLNSTVDAGYAKALTSIPLHRATKSVLRTLPGTLEAQTPSAGLFGGWGRSSAAAQGKGSDTREGEAEAATGEDVPDDAESLFGEEGVGEEKKSTPRGKGFFDDKRKSLQAEKLKKQAEDSKRAEEAAKQGKVERDRAERRMQALCEFGSVGEWGTSISLREGSAQALTAASFFQTLSYPFRRLSSLISISSFSGHMQVRLLKT